MASLARCIREDAGGSVDGVVGFSQGGAVAAMLAAALESLPGDGDGDGKGTRARAAGDGDGDGDGDGGNNNSSNSQSSWVPSLREANGGKALRFAVVYSGFYAPQAELSWLYEPKVRTPTLHFIGSLDTVVDEGRSRGLVARCEDPIVVVHPGGHYVPVSKEWVSPLVGFVRRWCEDDADES